MTVTKDDNLDKVLASAGSLDKTVIITIVNKAYVDGHGMTMLDLFLDAFHRRGLRELMDRLVIAAVDETSHRRCRYLRGLHCYKMKMDGQDFTGEKVYMSEDFIEMMWRRTVFLGDVLKRGYTILFTDTDVLWLRNPFPHLTQNHTIDLQVSTDNFNGDEWSESNPINTGFYMVRPSNRTAALFDSWHSMKDTSGGLKEQDVLNHLRRRRLFAKLGLTVRFLNTLYFSGFCEDSTNASAVTTVHANCCRRIAAKMADLSQAGRDFRRYDGLSPAAKLRFKWSNHSACMNSWS
ncbi:uncharacterized protein At1g28695-like [Andrographis paniculata]|uniref:uncharacterized protein At1g28695-like n=1 Tax=Andrographis paniculata TaxID=175694 RepID=UPI0021E6E7C8|nr:uncharacterized protein At1g28695-like [Andrographis paniculata]